MSSRILIRVALVIALLGSSPAVSHAQLKDVQDNGWSTLQEAYKLVELMTKEESKRNGKNISDAMDMTSRSMDKMKGYIEKMGAKVDDKDDKECATRERDNILKAWNAMDKALGDVGRKYAEEKGKLQGDLTKIDNELKKLQTAMEDHTLALSKAFAEYEKRSKLIKDSSPNAIRDKVKELQKKFEDRAKDWKAISEKLENETANLKKLNNKEEGLAALVASLNAAGNLEAWAEKCKEYTGVISDSTETMKRIQGLTKEYADNLLERVKVLKDLDAAQKQLASGETAVLQRRALWEAEFPEGMIKKFKSLK
jgi:hypothetical protein